MSRHEDTVRIRHMLDYARETVTLVQGRSRRALESDRVFSLALVRLLEIVGEAASRVSQEARLQYARIPWWQVVNLRNRLIHGYYEVDFDIYTIMEKIVVLSGTISTAHYKSCRHWQ